MELNREVLNTEPQEITYEIQHLYKASKITPATFQETVTAEEVDEVQEGVANIQVAQARLVSSIQPPKPTGLDESYKTPELNSKAVGIRGGSKPQKTIIGDCVLNWCHQPSTGDFDVSDRVYITNRITSVGRTKNQGDRKARVTHVPNTWKGEDTELRIITDNGLKTMRALKFLNELVEIYE